MKKILYAHLLLLMPSMIQTAQYKFPDSTNIQTVLSNHPNFQNESWHKHSDLLGYMANKLAGWTFKDQLALSFTIEHGLREYALRNKKFNDTSEETIQRFAEALQQFSPYAQKSSSFKTGRIKTTRK